MVEICLVDQDRIKNIKDDKKMMRIDDDDNNKCWINFEFLVKVSYCF